MKIICKKMWPPNVHRGPHCDVNLLSKMLVKILFIFTYKELSIMFVFIFEGLIDLYAHWKVFGSFFP